MSAFRAAPWAEFFEFEGALARLAIVCGPQSVEHVEAARERALAAAEVAKATGARIGEAMLSAVLQAETEFYEGRIAGR